MDRLVYSAYASGWAVLRHLPEPAARALFDRLADSAWRRRGKRVLQLEANLLRVCPDADEARLRELSRAGMRSYMRYWQESFRLPVWGRARVLRDVRVDGFEGLREVLESGRGAVVALPHMGNWDLAGAWVASLGYPFTTVAERLEPERLFDRFVAFRESLGMEVLALTGGSVNVVGTLARRLRAGKLVCLVGDRDLSEAGIGVSFFGEATRMPAGPAALAQRTGAALMPVSLWYEGRILRGRIHPEVPVPAEGDRAEKTRAMTQAMADVWEDAIRAHPEDWHMLQRFWLADLPVRETVETGPVRPADPVAAGPVAADPVVAKPVVAGPVVADPAAGASGASGA
ncbi:phosphatidylinositol mannoside acyltransferase [Kitasatospora purpeofusca]|uniref:phosphatidylinositol mannoside acyltransferase n=1 Tax=Kitasatospora purpeofusca TaxID=67352 RepID=UPI0022514D00|nr:phosphatidylinositol mannoside acyltransferase [Kitasatospora purpeofusca]MCX4684544.1 phosphatidylinositol mannoside acyltransferase [Kitasatospora purpeofusca]